MTECLNRQSLTHPTATFPSLSYFDGNDISRRKLCLFPCMTFQCRSVAHDSYFSFWLIQASKQISQPCLLRNLIRILSKTPTGLEFGTKHFLKQGNLSLIYIRNVAKKNKLNKIKYYPGTSRYKHRPQEVHLAGFLVIGRNCLRHGFTGIILQYFLIKLIYE